jgi:hypothetical protein
MESENSVATLQNTSKNLLNQLWEILPYAGTWRTGQHGLIDNFPVPPEKTSYLLGIPFSRGSSNSVDPSLRLVRFGPETTNGPIRKTGFQTFFFDSYLTHQVKWEICPLKENVGDVSISFYSSQFLAEGVVAGANVCLPIITDAVESNCCCDLSSRDVKCRCKGSGGPAFYTTTTLTRKGSFNLTQWDSMYVVVNSSDVSVRLWVSYIKPKSFTIPNFSQAYQQQKYFVTDQNNRKVLAATEELLAASNTTVLRPTDTLVALTLSMIQFLKSKQVTISLFSGSKLEPPQVYPSIPFSLGNLDSENLSLTYLTKTEGLVGATAQGNGKAFQALTCLGGTLNRLTVTGVLSVKLPPLSPGEQAYTSTLSIVMVEIVQGRASVIASPQDPLVIALSPGDNFSGKLTCISNASVQNFGFQITETVVGHGYPVVAADFRKTRSNLDAPPSDMDRLWLTAILTDVKAEVLGTSL